MLVQAKTLLNKPVFLNQESSCGFIQNIIVDPENGRILAFLINMGLFRKPKVISEKDVLELRPDGLHIQNEKFLVCPSEIVRVKEVLERKIKILDAKAQTESKKSLGKIEDFLIETETLSIFKFYIKGGLFSPSLILPYDKVIKIEKGKIIFSDDVLEGKKATEAVAA